MEAAPPAEVQYEAAYFEGGKQVVIGPFDSAVRAAAAYVAEVEGRLERAEAKEEAARQKLERQEERAREKEEAKRKREERNKEEVLVYDESLVGRRVRCLWEAYGEWFVGTSSSTARRSARRARRPSRAVPRAVRRPNRGGGGAAR